MRKGFGILIAVMMLITTVLSGCQSKKTASDGEISLFLSLSEADTFRQTLVEAAQKKAEEEGIRLDVSDAQGSIENQVADIKAAAEAGYSVIFCGPVSVDTTTELKASAKDVPIIFFNSCPPQKQLKAEQYIYVGSDEEVAGQFQAEYVLDKLSDKEEINVVILKGPKSHSATTGRTKGVKETFAASGKKINYVFEDHADWDAQKAQNLFEVFLKTDTAADCVICNNDTMALGVIEACKNANIDLSSLLVLGVDATADGCSAIENGDMAFTVYQSATGQGEALIQAAVKFAKGESTEDIEEVTQDGKYVWVPFEKVDSSNVSEYQK